MFSYIVCYFKISNNLSLDLIYNLMILMYYQLPGSKINIPHEAHSVPYQLFDTISQPFAAHNSLNTPQLQGPQSNIMVLVDELSRVYITTLNMVLLLSKPRVNNVVLNNTQSYRNHQILCIYIINRALSSISISITQAIGCLSVYATTLLAFNRGCCTYIDLVILLLNIIEYYINKSPLNGVRYPDNSNNVVDVCKYMCTLIISIRHPQLNQKNM